MAFVEKYKSNTQKINIVHPDDQIYLYTNTFRCPYCYIVPAFNLNLDLDSILTVKVNCNCGEKELEISDFLTIYSKDYRGNLQCNACKEFATKNNTVFKITIPISSPTFPASPTVIALSNEIIIDNMITPIISSRIAADTIAVPILVFSFPSSFNAAIVTDTDVAVRITP